MIWIIGGTSEARKLVDKIDDLNNFIITVATDSGKEFIDSDKLRTGKMNYEEMGKFIDNEKVKVIIDLTHPFAKIVSDNAKKVANDKDIDYIRYTREVSNYDNAINLHSYVEDYEYINAIQVNVIYST